MEIYVTRKSLHGIEIFDEKANHSGQREDKEEEDYIQNRIRAGRDGRRRTLSGGAEEEECD